MTQNKTTYIARYCVSYRNILADRREYLDQYGMTIPHQCLEGKKAGDAYCMDRNQILTAIRRAIKFNYKYFGTGLAIDDYCIQSIGIYEEEDEDADFKEYSVVSTEA